MAKIVPLMQGAPVSEFGDVAFGETDRDQEAPNDLVNVPGWSALRYQRDVEMSEYQRGLRPAGEVSALPGNVRWTRRMSAGGNLDGRKMLAAKNAGYRVATQDDIGKEWLTTLPIGATIQPDGSITNAAGDCVLTFADASTAGRNARLKERKMLEATATAGEKTTDAEGRMESAAKFGISVEKSTSRP